MDDNKPTEIIRANTSPDRPPQWSPLQIGILILVAVVAVVFVVARGSSGENGGDEEPGFGGLTATKPWPTVITNTPTLTPTPSVTLRTPTPTATPTTAPTPTPTPIIVINQIEALGRLETTKYVMQTVVDIEKEPGNVFERVLGTDQLLLIAAGEVVAGFDLEKVETANLVVRGTTVTLKLPRPEIFYSRVDNEKTFVYERRTGIFRRPDQNLETEARRLAEQRLNEWALENEILSQAERSGIILLEAFLKSLGFSEVNIEVSSL